MTGRRSTPEGAAPPGARTYDPEFLLRPFLVTVEGFGEHGFHAVSRGRALADAWRSYCGAQDPVSFGRFLRMARVQTGDPGPRFGDMITVGGRKAFYVGCNGHYVQFAAPGAVSYSNSHPADVGPAT